MWYPPRRLHAKSSKKKGPGPALAAARWLLAVVTTIYLSWLLAFPGASGNFGLWLHDQLTLALGITAYLLPFLLLNGILARLRAKGPPAPITLSLASLACLLGAATACGLMGGGGLVGTHLYELLAHPLGRFFTFVLSAGTVMVSLQLLMDIRWSKVAGDAARLLQDDYRAWQKSRRELASQTAAAAPRALPDSPARTSEPVAPRVIEPIAPKASPKRREGEPAAAVSAAPPPGSPYANYQPPSFDLLTPPSTDQDRGKPTQAEIAAAIADLETTLKNFDIDAKVTGYAPGPVITRYELSPAPGVKVSSIVALNNDIALAMRAKGIRIIAPIPGKAAVGIEIPNARPAHVGLRDILQSRALPPEAAKLSFAVGLSSDGEPLAADLAKMPHLLVAGATNSGKSVLIHSLILSILYRARPDEVKFLMIDPKRLELTFYDGIPHLFDPMALAEKVSVVTNPKDAAKSLTAMVKLMERRQEKFQLHGARNIESFNKEADKKGQPREFYIVVVIDELADLMLIASDTVEDSIQRLTQMARAVGIHLVLATQRPSVDVITGVIKANLPSRIALQVISKVDSKVILDSTGAESLQGRGDLLYLAAGTQKPERCQGAFVSEEEIKKVADHLRSMGKPQYEAAETVTSQSGPEADLASFGVEPLEFSQALKLVLERRRVSQDLLKSQFGSSARATNILSLLEVKQLIHKPEGSNRWEIHFDQIEDYMRQHFPQVPLEKGNS